MLNFGSYICKLNSDVSGAKVDAQYETNLELLKSYVTRAHPQIQVSKITLIKEEFLKNAL
jgi:hypothetical protein